MEMKSADGSVNGASAMRGKSASRSTRFSPVKANSDDTDYAAMDAQAAGLQEHTDLKVKFIKALKSHQAAENSLALVVAELIDAEIDRDEVIEWGLEAEFSEGYVRSTVSRLYKEITGQGKNKPGQGAKKRKGVDAVVAYLLRMTSGDKKEAMALALSARRELEKQVKAEAKAESKGSK